jgi:NTE family protein
MESTTGKTGVVLAGGGARAAYQVGVLKALRDLLPEPKVNPFQIICGTSAGAVNAGALAVHADDFSHAVDNLFEVWRHFEPHHVYRSDFPGVVANSFRWLTGFFFGAFLKNRRISLLDSRPLESLLARRLDFSRIQHNVKAGALDAVAITCSGYTSGQSCSFFEGSEQFEGWQRSQRIGIKTAIRVEH